jgi:hypothetical protein
MKQTGGELVRGPFEINIVTRILAGVADPDDTKRELGPMREAK